MGHVTKISNLQSVWIDGVPYHVKDLPSVVGSKLSSDESDSEDGAQLMYLKLDPLSVGSEADGSTKDESSSEDEAPVILLRRSAQQKRPAPICTITTGE